MAASAPRWVASEDVPEDVVNEERELQRRKAEQDGRPAQAIDRIVEGQIKKFYEDNVLLEQPWIRDPKMPIKDLVTFVRANFSEQPAWKDVQDQVRRLRHDKNGL